jgi:hypothetical protein
MTVTSEPVKSRAVFMATSVLFPAREIVGIERSFRGKITKIRRFRVHAQEKEESISQRHNTRGSRWNRQRR